MGRRHREQQQRWDPPAAPGARPAGGPPTRRRGYKGVGNRYFSDFIGILGLAILLNLLFEQLGLANFLLRIFLALIVARILVTAIRVYFESRIRKQKLREP